MKNLTQRHGDTESWPKVRLGDVCEIVLGGTPKTGVPEYWDGDIPWLTPGEMGKIQGMYISDTKRKITRLGLEKGSKLFPAKSVILSTRAPIGYVFVNEVAMSTNQGCKTLVPSEKIEASYLAYNLIGRTSELNNLGTGTTFKELATGVLKDIEIPLPPLPVQREIVVRLEKELASVDRMVKGFEEMKAEADQLFKAELKEAFEDIKRRGAETRRLGEICDICTGKKDVRQGNPNGKYPFFTCARNPTYADVYSFDCAALLVAGNGDVGYTQKYEGKFEAYQRTYVLTHFCEADIDFMHCIMQGLFGEWAHANIMGNTMPYIKMGVVKEFAFPLPSLTTQREVVAKLDAVREKCAKLKSAAEEGLKTAALLRKAILKEAFE